MSINDDQQREKLLRLLAALSFLIFFQAYMVAPIIPALAASFHAPIHTVALVVPAYLIPYGVGKQQPMLRRPLSASERRGDRAH
jgi:MFS family permease